MTIFRLTINFGYRQLVWTIISAIILIAGMRLRKELIFLRRYKYLLLTSGLALTALTLILGTNPGGFGPRLWLGCCGVYLQPSEPLKFLLVVFLAAYFASRLPLRARFFPLIFPTAILTGLALLILLIQRDLGTASIFIFLYAVMLYFASGKLRLLIGSLFLLIIAGIAGYFLIDIVRLRLDVWLNPWSDPSGKAYQIIQSLLAIANGGIFGRSPGLGSPGLVPVAISDFVYTAIAEETGLIGTIGLIALIGLLIVRGLIISLRAEDSFQRLLAAGLTSYLGAQSILIIGGNLRLLPLTGVTLPFISYGGSSLVTSFIALTILLIISSREDGEPAPLENTKPYWMIGALILIALAAAAIANGWWSVWRASDLLARSDNPRRAIADRYVMRGTIFDRNTHPINQTIHQAGNLSRVYLYPALSPVIGFSNPVYAQTGLEQSLDDLLRGLTGHPAEVVAWEHFLYGTPPPGVDARLSIDLDLQRKADEMLGDHSGAIVLINAATGEILAMASHPTFDANRIEEIGEALLTDVSTPLINRAAQGQYPAPIKLFDLKNRNQHEVYKALGLFNAPQIELPAAESTDDGDLKVSPLQIALAFCTISANGSIPAPRIVMALNDPAQGWITLTADHDPVRVLSAEEVESILQSLPASADPFWGYAETFQKNEWAIHWYVTGTTPGWVGVPLTAAILLEDGDADQAAMIGSALIQSAIKP
jgi:cell division protein FtsW (lipid II flippase)